MRTLTPTLLLSIAAAGTVSAQRPTAVTPDATPLLVTLDAKQQSGRLDRLKSDLGVIDSKPVPDVDAEIWQVPAERLKSAFAAAGRHRGATSIDYSGEDYRSLFLPVSTQDLGPAAALALQRVTADPKLSDVKLVRLREGDITSRVLKRGFGPSAGLAGRGSVLMNMRPGLDVSVQRERIKENGGGSYSWSGQAVATADSSPDNAGSVPAEGGATLVVEGDRILGSVEVGTETFSMIPLSGGLHAIAKVNPSAFPPDHPPARDLQSAPARNDRDAPSPIGPSMPAESGAVLDRSDAVLSIGVAYTKQAATALAMARAGVSPRALAELGVGKTNEGFQASRMKARVQLAGTLQLVGSEAGDFDSMVGSIVAPDDGRFDAIHTWRRRIKADAVLVLVDMGTYCGQAAEVGASMARSFAIVNWSCAVDNLSLPHEFGHLLGARHDHETDPVDKPFAYAHGYRYKNSWRTVMGYMGGECSSCPRMNRWADPGQSYDGVPLGTVDRNHDARLIDEQWPKYSRFFVP